MNLKDGRAPTGDIVIYDDRDEACRYQVRRLREWGAAKRLTMIPASDPRALVWFGATEDNMPRGTFAYLRADGSWAQGEEAVLRILDALPAGQGKMHAVLLGERAPGQGDPSQALWECDDGAHPDEGRPRARPLQFDGRGRLKPSDPMGH